MHEGVIACGVKALTYFRSAIHVISHILLQVLAEKMLSVPSSCFLFLFIWHIGLHYKKPYTHFLV